MTESLLGGVITFLEKLGVYDVVLPFLLVFTIVFAILEKTRVFGEEKIEGKDYSRKNLNAMAAFVIGFLVIASSQLVQAISQISAHIFVILLLIVFFLLLVGSFYGEGKIGKEGLQEEWARNIFIVVIFLAIAFVFLNALPAGQGKTWLEWIFQGSGKAVSSPATASIVLIILIVIFIRYVSNSGNGGGNTGGSTEEKGKDK